MTSKAYQGVEVGRVTGIYTTWSAAKEQVDGFCGECHEGFDTLEECVNFMLANNKHTEGNLKVFGPRGGQYSLRDWKKKQEATDIEQTYVKLPISTSVDASAFRMNVEPTRHAQCQTCTRVISDVVTALSTITKRLDAMDNYQSRLTSLLEAKTVQCDTLSTECSDLRIKVHNLTLKIQEQTWKTFRAANTTTKSLLIGSSIIRDVKEDQLIDTKVISKSGARISNLCEVVDNLPQGVQYDRAILVAGGNDCDREQTAEDVLKNYKTLGEKIKKISPSLTVSSICPRMVPDGITDRIDAVNAGLQVMCADEGWTYVNNDSSFHLGDGEINNGYLIPDGVHLTRRATNRLAQNLSLKIKDPKAGVCGAPHTKRNTTPRNKQHSHAGTPEQTTTDTTDNTDPINVNHAFWNSARRKAAKHTTAHTYPQHVRSHTEHLSGETNARTSRSMLLLW